MREGLKNGGILLFFIFSRYKGITNFEQDFMVDNLIFMSLFRKDPLAAHEWLSGMNTAAEQLNIPIQYCMALPSDVLASLSFNMVTNARASDDYPCWDKNWNIGPTSLLYYALDLSPSKDNFWTMPNQPESCYTDSRCSEMKHLNYELDTFLAILSAGPVGISDKIGYTDKDLIMKTCTSSGLLLQPSKPLTPIDTTYFFSSSFF